MLTRTYVRSRREGARQRAKIGMVEIDGLFGVLSIRKQRKSDHVTSVTSDYG